MAAYVIKSWRATDQPDVHSNFVTITGRKEGIISWLLALFRIDPTVSITVSDTRIEFSEASLSGSVRRLIPLPGICSTLYGYHKPWRKAIVVFFLLAWLLTAFSSAIASMGSGDSFSVGGLFIALIVSFGIAILYYFLNRTLTLGFVENSGIVSAIQFKRSVVENQDINEAQAGYVCQVVQALLEARQRAILQP